MKQKITKENMFPEWAKFLMATGILLIFVLYILTEGGLI